MLYAQHKPRLLMYDPKAEYPGVDYMTPPDDWLEDVITQRRPQFRFGTYRAEDVEMFGSAAYAAGNCTLILEECKMLFDRGEDIAPWARPLIYMGREPKLNLVLCAQRANAIPLDVRSQANRIVTFLQTDPDDCRAIASRIGADVRDDIRSLDYLECIDWTAPRTVRRYFIRHPKDTGQGEPAPAPG